MVFFEGEAQDSQQMHIDTIRRAIVHRLHSPLRYAQVLKTK